MEPIQRRTVVAHGRLAMREAKMSAARNRGHGLQVMTWEQLAARLTGGFAQPVDDETLREAIHRVLPNTPLGELDAIKCLPGFVGAAADTLRKAWRADIDLAKRGADHPRLQSVAALETAVLGLLPPSMMRPTDLVRAALGRIEHAPVLFGAVDIVGITELSPCWRPLLAAMATKTAVRWVSGPRVVPAWLDSGGIKIVRSPSFSPQVTAVSAATALHEAIEALRWARQLMTAGAAPTDIAIASVTPADYDDHFLALRSDANIDLHFAHGIQITASREGQTAAALADILVRGLSQTRIRRLATLLGAEAGPFQEFPEGWTRLLPTDSPLSTETAWNQLLGRLTAADWTDGIDHSPALRELVRLLRRGAEAAETTGETLLRGRALKIWRKALSVGPATSIDLTLELLKQDDGLDACASVTWMPASALAASPRRFVRLLGLNSSRWPRGISEDRLLSDHIIPTRELDPLPVGDADRRDFETILVTTERQVVLSRARRDSDGRLLGRSPLLRDQPDESYLPRNRIPEHAFSETDRLMARPEEFQSSSQARAANACWRDWHLADITPHDGLVRPNHPVIRAILGRTQSASSLRLLLRSPIGFVWKYGLGLRTPESGSEPLVLDALAQGDLVHMTLERAVRPIEAEGGLAKAGFEQIRTAVNKAADEVRRIWEIERAVPPRLIWRRTLDDASELGVRALTFDGERLADARNYAEVPFGGSVSKSDAELPWDASAPVEIPETGFRIAGYIDRLDIAKDGCRAHVLDYKTGRAPSTPISLNGGKELQRCLYAFAVKALLGSQVAIGASLLYPRDQVELALDDPEAVLADVIGYLDAAKANLISGVGIVGTDTGGDYDDLAFALPANAAASYCKRKIGPATDRLGVAANVWEAP